MTLPDPTVPPPFLLPIEARGLRAMLPSGRCLLLVIDIQNDFAAPDGAMGRIGLDLAAGEAAIDRIEALVEAARAACVAIGFARLLTNPQAESEALRLFHERRFGSAEGTAICREGTKGADYYRLRPRPGDIEVGKRLYSCFQDTGLAERLRERGIDTLLLAGMTTDCCVGTTARHGFELGFNLFVVVDACADYDEAAHRAELAALGRHCAVLTQSATVIAALARADQADVGGGETFVRQDSGG